MPRPKGSKNLTPKQRAKLRAEALPIGQPPKWIPAFNEAIIEWFNKEAFREHADEKSRIQLIPTRLPTFEGFAHSIGVCVDTLHEWKKDENREKYPSFSESYARAKQLQKELIMACGMAGAGNAQFAIFLLKNNHDMKDTTDLTNNGGDFEVPPMYDATGKPYKLPK